MTSELTPRQIEIVALLDTGLTNREVGLALFIEEKSVKNQVNRIRKKTGRPKRRPGRKPSKPAQ